MLRGEHDFLVATFDTPLDPRLLRRRRDVHELHANVPAVGAAQDGEDLAHRGHVETQNLVNEHGSVEISLGEAVGLRAKLLVHLALGEARGSRSAARWPMARRRG